MSWSRKHQECQMCHTTVYSHKAKGLCNYCYKTDRMNKVINECKSSDALQIFSNQYLGVTEYQKIIELSLEKQKTLTMNALIEIRTGNLSLYNKIESSNHIDLLMFEQIFNLVSSKLFGKKKQWNHKLTKLFNESNEKTKKIYLLQLLKMIL
jgi:hypothetical protein